MNKTNNPHCLSNRVKPNAIAIMHQVATCVPAQSNLYLIAGAMRNTIYYREHQESLPQRDYDVIYIGQDVNLFTDNLEQAGFTKGEIYTNKQKVYKKPAIDNPSDINDYLVLDIGIYKTGNIRDIICNKANFTINSFYIEVECLLKENWLDYVGSLESAESDIKDKILRLNPNQSEDFRAYNLHAAIRFISQGFSVASDNQLKRMVDDFVKDMPKQKFDKRVNKVYSYVGGEEKAKQMVEELGIEFNIFDYSDLEDRR